MKCYYWCCHWCNTSLSQTNTHTESVFIVLVAFCICSMLISLCFSYHLQSHPKWSTHLVWVKPLFVSSRPLFSHYFCLRQSFFFKYKEKRNETQTFMFAFLIFIVVCRSLQRDCWRVASICANINRFSWWCIHALWTTIFMIYLLVDIMISMLHDNQRNASKPEDC